MSRFNGNHIEYPDAYARAVDARIKSNRCTTGRRKLEAAIANDSDDFKAWIFGTTPASLRQMGEAAQAEFDRTQDSQGEASTAYSAAFKAWTKRYGWLPDFLREAMDRWGGLTDGQLACARRIFAERVQKADKFAEQTATRIANSPAWTKGRQQISGVVKSARWNEFSVGYGQAAQTLKGLVELPDGRRLWTTIPSIYYETLDNAERAVVGTEIKVTVTVEPAADDPTMAFGSRPRAA